jgi:hypothetical protein
MDNRRILSASLLTLALAVAPLAAFGQEAGDPPGRVGRLAEASGSVSFHTSDSNAQWAPASVNYPVTGGNAFWTEPRSHAAIDVGASRLYMDSSTELDVGNVDDHSFTASLAQGAVYLRMSPAANGDQYEIDTPRGAVHINQPGSYEVIGGDQDHPTTVMVFDGGSAEVTGPGVSAGVASGQALFIAGQNPPRVNEGPAQTDDFIRFVQTDMQPYQVQNAYNPPPYVSPEMTGYQDLDRYGQWGQDPNYGQLWYPQVAADWAPYRDGHWAYVAPWGWTWIDDAPWGFTPFHYGRWVQIGGRWAWWPGRVVAQPVYAPALVTFFGNIGGIGLALGIGGGQDVGWVPLAPDEVYVPPYRYSPTYVRNMNITYVHNETTIVNVVNNKTVINNYTYNNYHNHNGATFVAASTMEGSRPVAPEFHKFAPTGHVDPQKWANAKPTFTAPVKPTNETKGVVNYQGKGAPGPNFAGDNRQPFNGKLPPLANSTTENGQGKSGQGLAGKKNGQPMFTQTNNGQIKNGQTNQNGQKTFTQTNGQNQNGQNLKNQNNGVAGGNKLPPLPNGQGPSKNGQGNVGQNQNGKQPQYYQGGNGQFQPGQNNGPTNHSTGQNQNGKQPQYYQGTNGQLQPGQNNTQTTNHSAGQNQNQSNRQPQFNQGQNNAYGTNGQSHQNKNNNQFQYDQGQGNGQPAHGNGGQNVNLQNGRPNYYSQGQGQWQGQSHYNNGGAPSTQKVEQKQQNNQNIYQPPNGQLGSDHKN